MVILRPLIRAIKGKSLAAQFIRTSILFSVISIAIMGLGLIWIADHALRESTFRLQEESAQKVSLVISGYVRDAMGDLQLFENIDSLPTMSPAEQKNALEKLIIHRQSLFSQITLLNPKGNEAVKVSRFHTFLPHELGNQTSSPAFIEAITGQLYISPVYISSDSGLLSVQIAVPVKNRKTNSVLIAEINISQLWQEVARLQIGRTGYAYLVDRKGRFIAYQEPAAVLQRYGENMERIPPVTDFMGNKPRRVQEYQGLNGVPVIGAFAPIQGTAWAVIVELPAKEAYASLYSMLWFLTGLTILAMVSVVWIGFAVALHLVRPIRALTVAVQRIGGGDLKTELVEIRRHDEVGELARAFRQMQEELQALYKSMEQQLGEIKQAEQALKKSEGKYRELVENANSIILRMDKDGNITFFNEFAQQFFGYAEDEILGKNVIGTIVPEIESTGRDLKGLIQDMGRYPERYINNLNENMRRNAERVWIAWTNKPIHDADGKVMEILCIGNDITERKQAEEELRDSQRRLTDIIEFLPDATIVIDKDAKVIAWNRAIEIMTGVMATEMLGKGNYEYALPFYGTRRPILIDLVFQPKEEIQEQYSNINWQGDVLIGEAYIPDLRGNKAYLFGKASPLYDTKGSIIGAIETIRDITERIRIEKEREKLQSQLIQAQKMEAVGTLAGGIAHDFNNILSGIMGYSELCLKAMQDRPKVYHHLKQVLTAAERAKDLVRQILTFSRKAEQEKRPLALAPIVEEVVNFMRASLPTTIEFIQKIVDTSDVIVGDPTQMHQILVNLCTNAGHAMKETGGVLEIVLEEVVIDANDRLSRPPMRHGHYLVLTVRDTGHGIPAENIERIFEPYFTTKEKGAGTGLGLAVVHGIVKDHGGEIRVYSEIGKGTTIRVYLPLMEKEEEEGKHMKEALLPGKGEAILFIDDEKMVVDLSRELLEELGYRVVTETDPVKAIEAFKEGSGAFDLVITDKTMPHLTGFEVAREIRLISKDIPILLCSGFQEKEDLEKLAPLGIDRLITKPIRMTTLAKAIRDVLDKKQGEG